MSDSSTSPFVVLAVGGPRADAVAAAGALGDHAQLHAVPTLEDAISALRSGPVDLVLLNPAALTGLGGFYPTEPAAVALDAGTPALCLTEQSGNLLWASPRMLALPEPVQQTVREQCTAAFSWATEGEQNRFSHLRGRRFTVDHDGRTYEGTITPVMEMNDRAMRVAAVVWDATRAKTLREKIDAIDKAGAELVSLDAEQIARLNAQQRLDLLEQKLIRYTRELMQFDNFTVFLLDRKTNRLEVVLSSGMPSAVRDIPLYAAPEGNGISGYVAAKGKSYICPEIRKDDRYLPGIEGAQSSLTVPLKLHDKVVGVFNVESRQPAAFTEDDRQFAEIFSRHLAVALHILNLLITERYATTGQLASDVMAEITGPLNDILTDVSGLLEDFIGHDELRHRLNQISDNAVRVRDAMRVVASRDRGISDRRHPTGAVNRDPVLQGRRILVADDEEVIRETVCDVLRSCGCDVQDAADGAIAVDLISQHEFDLVLSDIKMPARSGYEIFAAAKDRNKDCPVILMTGFGYDPNHSIVRARREGLAAVLFKPFKVEQLLGEIRTAIRSVSPRA
jgi:two-component system, sensor histidine kinase SagS